MPPLPAAEPASAIGARARGVAGAHRIGGWMHDAMSKNMNASAFS
jgi:hypothetical protein